MGMGGYLGARLRTVVSTYRTRRCTSQIASVVPRRAGFRDGQLPKRRNRATGLELETSPIETRSEGTSKLRAQDARGIDQDGTRTNSRGIWRSWIQYKGRGLARLARDGST